MANVVNGLGDNTLMGYVLATMEAKEIPRGDTEAMARVIAALEKSLERIYKAVVIDIDETVTSKDQAETAELAAIVGNYASQRVHFAIITGRGRSGAEDYLRNYLLPAVPKHAQPQVDVICHHAAYFVNLAEYSQVGLNQDVPWEELISSDTEKERLDAVETTLVSVSSATQVDWTREPFSFRILNPSEDAERQVRSIANLQNLTVSEGVYQSIRVLDLRTVTKADALRHWSALRGIAASNILRIGDMGGEGGADFELLDSESGFSVGTVSNSAEGCFAVGDSISGAQIKGAAATRKLLDDAMFRPPIALSVRRNDEEAMRQFYDFQRQAARRARIEWRRVAIQFSLMVAKFCEDADTIDPEKVILDVFDPKSGAVRVRDEEGPQVSAAYSLLSEYFAIPIMSSQEVTEHEFRRSAYSDAAILLRGRDHYGTFGKSDEEIDLKGFLTDRRTALKELWDIVADLPKPQQLVDLKLVVAAFDYVRQTTIQVVQAVLSILERERSRTENQSFVKCYEALISVEECFSRMTLEPVITWTIWLEDFRRTIGVVLNALDAAQKDIEVIDSSLVRVKDLFHWRETDWIIESFAAVKLALEKTLDDTYLEDPPVFVGIAFGGIELPAIGIALANRLGISADCVIARVSHYDNFQHGEVIRSQGSEAAVKLADTMPSYWLRGTGDYTSRRVIILDDNVTTGFTLEITRDVLVHKGADPVAAGIVRYVGANRWHHLCKHNHAMVSPVLMFEFVRGLISPSPYTRILGNYAGEADYQDSLGNFDKAKARIRRLIDVKNNSVHPSV